MRSAATNRERLLQIAEVTLELLGSGRFAASLAESSNEESIAADGVPRDIVANALSAALDWARLEERAGESAAREESLADSAENVPYIPSNQVLALLQSAYDEYMKERGGDITEAPFDPTDLHWASVAWEKLKALFRGKRKFIRHSNAASFRQELPTNAVVALFSDWGTGEPTAKRVMEQIRLALPTHAIHLGDVYYSGTPSEVKERFLDIVDEHGPPKDKCRYFSLNANHDMYSGGYGYFDSILPRFGQEASYFNLRNEHWQLIGLDSGYEDHGLQDPQKEWLSAQLQDQGSKSILLSHHQLFSPYEDRASERTLFKKVSPLLAHVHAWFWGHEHKCIIFGDHLGIKARCIGHGAIPIRVPFGPAKFTNIPIHRVDERSGPPPDGGGLHGFALLRFAADKIDISYIDEFGTVFLSEQFGV